MQFSPVLTVLLHLLYISGYGIWLCGLFTLNNFKERVLVRGSGKLQCEEQNKSHGKAVL